MYFLVGGRQKQALKPAVWSDQSVGTLSEVSKKKAKPRVIPVPIVSYKCRLGRHAECTSLKCICECNHGGMKGARK